MCVCVCARLSYKLQSFKRRARTHTHTHTYTHTHTRTHTHTHTLSLSLSQTHTQLQEFKAGQAIVKQGEDVQSLCVLIEGAASVGPAQVHTLNQNLEPKTRAPRLLEP